MHATDARHSYVGLVERGEQNITIDSLVRLAKALRCKPSALLAEAGI